MMARGRWSLARVIRALFTCLVLLIITVILHTTLMVSASVESSNGWSSWWTYTGISGTEFWGLVNPDWALCFKGRRQSPISVDPKRLVYDPGLRTFRIDKHRVHGYLRNTGQLLRFDVDNTTENWVNITGGPLSYRYRLTTMTIHFGSTNKKGSEHQVDGITYPAEIQLLAYNTDLYPNETLASKSPNGLAAISILAQLGSRPNEEFAILMQRLHDVKYKEQSVHVKYVSFRDLLPNTMQYLTYEGSLTYPPCYETVTWLVMNKPLYITERQLSVLRQLRQGTMDSPHTSLEDNVRPPQSLHHRMLRTNIMFNTNLDVEEPTVSTSGSASCPRPSSNFFYQANHLWNT